VVFDELQLADPGVRRALAPFLSGRRRVPVENEVVRIAPVALLTMNPGAGKTLTERTGLAAPQLRRMIVCDLGRVEMPNLVLVGGRALEAAADAGPLPLRPPQDSAERFRPAVVRLLPQVLQAEVLGLDVVLLAVVLIDPIDANNHVGLTPALVVTRRSHRSKNQLPIRYEPFSVVR